MGVFYFFTGAFFGNILTLVLLFAITVVERGKKDGEDNEK